MGFEKDFVLNEVKEFEIEGRKFKFKLTDSDDELDWVNSYIEVNEKGNLVQNIRKRSKCKFSNLIEVPWNDETIKKASKKILGEEKIWKDLTKEEKSELLGKLHPRIYDKIINKFDKLDGERSPVKKNS